MDASIDLTKIWEERFRPLLRFHPCTGRLWLDCVLLIIVGALHHTTLPWLTGGTVPIDLLTPWLVVTMVAAPLTHAMVLIALGALIIETHTSAPAGLYFVGYWIVAAVLYQLRATLSWRHLFPWTVTFAASQLWLVTFETFVLTVANGVPGVDLGFILAQVGRLLSGVGLGLLMARRFMRGDCLAEGDH